MYYILPSWGRAIASFWPQYWLASEDPWDRRPEGVPIMHKRHIVCGLIVAVLFAACAKSGGPTQTQGVSTATPAAVSPDAALLAASDLPGSGWSQQDLPPSALTNECVAGINDIFGSDRTARTSYTKGQTEDQLALSVAQLGDDQSARAIMTKLRSAVQCPAWTETVQGSNTRFQISAATAPGLGEEAVGYKLDWDVSGVHVASNVVAIRRKSVITAVSNFHVGVATLSRSLVDDVATRAYQKLVRVGL